MKNLSGLVSVHVSGLPAICDDAVVEAELRKALDRPMGTCGMRAITNNASLDEPQGKDGGAAVVEKSDASADEIVKATEVRAELENLKDASADDHDVTETDAAQVTSEGVSEPTETAAEESKATLLSDSCYSCSLPRKKTGESKGFCFLEFVTLEAAEAATHLLNAGVQISGSMVSAQLARQNAAAVTQGMDQHFKGKNKKAKQEKEEAFFYPQIRIKRGGYNKSRAPGQAGGPPLRKTGARPIGEEKTAKTLLNSIVTKSKEDKVKVLLALADAEQLLQLKNGELSLNELQLALTDVQTNDLQPKGKSSLDETQLALTDVQAGV